MKTGGAGDVGAPMGNSRNFKRRVRARMERTGESYTAALHAMRQAQQHDAEVAYGRMTDAEVFAEYGEHLGVPLPATHDVSISSDAWRIREAGGDPAAATAEQIAAARSSATGLPYRVSEDGTTIRGGNEMIVLLRQRPPAARR